MRGKLWLRPSLRCQGFVKFVGMMAAAVFKTAGFGVCFAIRPAAGHSVALMQFVQEDVRALLLDYRIIDPYFVLGYELVYVIMTPFCEVDIEYTAYKASVHNPYG